MICPSCGRDPEIGEWPFDCRGRGHTMHKQDAQIHTSEKVVFFENPRTGEVRIPGRGDRPMNPKLAACGFERRTADTVGAVRRLEKRTGKISEVLNYDKNSVQAERDTGSV